ncbi:DMT family transporter [Thalassotalea sp. LPB0316]|uniref:DMT family transporter n=1 Tax=Thalassotalea sp. LPB0316 TaxID=2769490 RepID=UPI0018667ADB|nr:DMT family transporter [Thalassotalea sp. LPB0316]QOL26663.1 DMT family transporter [Thalassotalea sp. LPB0316]
MLWVFFTCFAAFCQAGRNALQSQLSAHLSVSGVTLARFLWASPLALVYLVVIHQLNPTELPSFSATAIFFICSAAVMQIIATALMVVLFKQKNFAIGAGLAKCEAPVAAFLGVLFFGTQLTQFGWLGVMLGAIAIMMLSTPNKITELSLKTVAIGLACSTAFALTSLWVREATLALHLPFPHRAAWVLFLVISLQTVLLVSYLLVKNSNELRLMAIHKKKVTYTSIASFLGSLGWFSAMSLQTVPLVKTLGQIEIFFMMLISIFILKERPPQKDLVALFLIAIAAIMVIV